jgi:CspA family cold shock protein
MFINKMSSFKDTVTPSAVSTSAERLLGRVKWFNSKAGYGFITVTDGQRSGSDIFVHHSAVDVENQQYRYLVQGEYVEFTLVATPNGNHEFQASAVCGIKSGKLMCETRREFKIARNNYRTSAQPNSSNESVEMPRQQRPPRPSRTNAPRARGNGPRDENGKEWTLVGKTNNQVANTQQSRPSDSARPRRGRPAKQQSSV